MCAVGGTESVSGNSYVAVVTLTPNGSNPSWDTPFQLVSGPNSVGLSCTSTGYCGAMVNSGGFYYSTNSGGSWTAGATGPPAGRGNNYTNVSCSSAGTSSTCVVVGYCPGGVGGCYSASYGEVAGTSDSGTTWSSGTIGGGLAQASCGSTTECVVLGFQEFGCGYGCTWAGPLAATVTPSTGATRTDVLPTSDSSTQGTQLGAIACTDATTCFIGGSYGIEETTDAVHFTPVAFETPALSQISCGSTLDCMAVTQTGGLAATNNGGAMWYNLPPLQLGNCLTTPTCYTARNVACSSGSKCILSFDSVEYSGGCGCGQVGVVTTNLGLTWTSRSDASNTLGCAEGASACEGIGTFSSGGWQADLSNDGGSTYTTVAGAVTDGSSAAAVSCGSASMCMAVGSSPYVQLSTYSGIWTNTVTNTGISDFR